MQTVRNLATGWLIGSTLTSYLLGAKVDALGFSAAIVLLVLVFADLVNAWEAI